MVPIMRLPLEPPVDPMLAKAVAGLPDGEGWIYEPKWDGFRAIVFRDGDEVYIQSRDRKPLDRYFPELAVPLRANLPERCVVDGEIVIAIDGSLDFDALLLRIHPAASRVAMLAEQSAASFVAWDLLALGDEALLETPQGERRVRLESALAGVRAPVHITPATRDRDTAADWFERFEGAGLDGVVAKPLAGTYQPDKRVMFKIKHVRTADCVVAGYRAHKTDDHAIGSLLLGLHDEAGQLANVGVIGAFPMATRRKLFDELQPLVTTLDDHPWAWAKEEEGARTPRHSEFSRWSAGKDLTFVPLRPERVVEVKYDHMEGDRFRHTAQFVRWRDDRDPASCTYAQLEEPASIALAEVLGTA